MWNVDPIEQKVRLHLGFALLLGHLIQYCALEMEEAELDGDVAVLLTLLFDEYFLKGSDRNRAPCPLGWSLGRRPILIWTILIWPILIWPIIGQI